MFDWLRNKIAERSPLVEQLRLENAILQAQITQHRMVLHFIAEKHDIRVVQTERGVVVVQSQSESCSMNLKQRH